MLFRSWKIFDGIEAPSGDAAVATARNRAVAFERRYGAPFPAAVECLMADFSSLTTYLRFRPAPPEDPPLQFHRAHLRRNP